MGRNATGPQRALQRPRSAWQWLAEWGGRAVDKVYGLWQGIEKSKRELGVTGQYFAFYEACGTDYVPTDINLSPWNGKGQNGIAMAGLAAHVICKMPSPAEMHTARLSIDILGLVPRIPVQPRLRVLREGRRVQLIEAELVADGRTYVRATALRTRIAPSPLSEPPLTRPLPDPAKARGKVPWVTMHLLEGGFAQIGPGAQWVRFCTDVVAGHPLSPLERVAMVSDFGSSVAPLVSPARWTFANHDITVHLTRLPKGEWVLMDVTSQSSGNGVGVIHTQLGDTGGMIGHAHQTVFLDQRAG